MPVTYIPVFAGKTPDGEKVVVYKHVNDPSELHILRPDGELWALSPGSEVTFKWDLFSDKLTFKVESPEWSGTAEGTKRDIVEAEAR